MPKKISNQCKPTIENIIQEQAIRIKEAIRMAREILHGLSPKDLYYRLKDLPESDLLISEYTLIKIYELCYPNQQENAELSLQVNVLKNEIRFKNEKMKLLAMEIENTQSILNDKELVHSNFVENLQKEKNTLHEEIKRGQEELNKIRQRIAIQDEVAQENKLLKEEMQILRHKIQIYEPNSNPVAEIQEERKSLYRKIEKMQRDFGEQEKEMIKVGCENRKLNEKMAELEQESKRIQMKNEGYVEEIIKIQKNISDGFERRLNNELEGIRERHSSEIELVKQSLVGIYEKQLLYLKDQKEEMESQTMKLKIAYREIQEKLDETTRENREISRKYDGDYHETKANLKYTKDEANRKTMELQLLKQSEGNLKLEVETLREQLTMLKSEAFTSQIKFAEEIGKLRSENAILTRELRNYDLIEAEIDKGIINSSKDRNSNQGELDLILSAPTSKNKRILQAMSLGHMLSNKERENCELIRKIESLELKNKQISEEYQSLKKICDITKQPGNYLVRICEEKEIELLGLRKKINELNQTVEKLNFELKNQTDKCKKLTQKLEELEIKKKEIVNMQNLLVNIAESCPKNVILEKNLNLIKKVMNSEEREIPVRDENSKAEECLNEKNRSPEKPKWLRKIQNNAQKKQLF